MCRVRHAKGLSFLARLLAHPGDRMSALELQRAVEAGGGEAEAENEPLSWEKARLNVTRALRLLLKKIAAYHPSAAAHLASAIRTGKLCSYTPDPKLAIDWQVSTDPVPIRPDQNGSAARLRGADR
jgi:hypothetical protein